MQSDDAEGFAAAMRSLGAMTNYANSVTCRHKALVEYFGQALRAGQLRRVRRLPRRPGAGRGPRWCWRQKILSCVARLEQRFGGDYTAKVLAGSAEARILSTGHDKLSTYGLLNEFKPTAIRDWIEQLVGQGYLRKEGEYDLLQITETGLQLLKGNASPRLLQAAAPAAKQRRAATADDWEGVDRGLFDKLRAMRGEIAAERGVPAYVVFGDTALRDMARLRPSSPEGFAEVKGVGAKKLHDFGAKFVKAISAYCEQQGLATDQFKTPLAQVASLGDDEDGPSAAAVAAFGCFREGLSVAEASARLAKANSTVVGYLNQFLRHYQVTDPSPWVAPPLARRIEEAIEEVGLGRLRPIFEHLGGDVDYDSIRIVATCVANRDA